jgi:hypothetical protein
VPGGARQFTGFELPRIPSFARGCAGDRCLPLPVLVPLQIELAAALPGLRFSVNEDKIWIEFTFVLNHWDKLPFTVHCAILFQVGFAASRFTIHLSRTEWTWILRRKILAEWSRIFHQVSYDKYGRIDSKLNSKPESIP